MIVEDDFLYEMMEYEKREKRPEDKLKDANDWVKDAIDRAKEEMRLKEEETRLKEEAIVMMLENNISVDLISTNLDISLKEIERINNRNSLKS